MEWWVWLHRIGGLVRLVIGCLCNRRERVAFLRKAALILGGVELMLLCSLVAATLGCWGSSNLRGVQNLEGNSRLYIYLFIYKWWDLRGNSQTLSWMWTKTFSTIKSTFYSLPRPLRNRLVFFFFLNEKQKIKT